MLVFKDFLIDSNIRKAKMLSTVRFDQKIRFCQSKTQPFIYSGIVKLVLINTSIDFLDFVDLTKNW